MSIDRDCLFTYKWNIKFKALLEMHFLKLNLQLLIQGMIRPAEDLICHNYAFFFNTIDFIIDTLIITQMIFRPFITLTSNK